MNQPYNVREPHPACFHRLCDLHVRAVPGHCARPLAALGGRRSGAVAPLRHPHLVKRKEAAANGGRGFCPLHEAGIYR